MSLLPEYKTQDIALAAYLVLQGEAIKYEHNMNSTVFVFPPTARKRAEEYMQEDCRVHPRLLLEAFREIKKQMMTEREFQGL